jgi:uncharacterized protein (DUF952 family)
MNAKVIYHLMTKEQRVQLVQGEQYAAPSLNHEGFIHASSDDQLSGVVERHYPSEPELYLMTIALDRLSSQVKWEEGFPHIYGPINPEAIIEINLYR